MFPKLEAFGRPPILVFSQHDGLTWSEILHCASCVIPKLKTCNNVGFDFDWSGCALFLKGPDWAEAILTKHIEVSEPCVTGAFFSFAHSLRLKEETRTALIHGRSGFSGIEWRCPVPPNRTVINAQLRSIRNDVASMYGFRFHEVSTVDDERLLLPMAMFDPEQEKWWDFHPQQHPPNDILVWEATPPPVLDFEIPNRDSMLEAV